MFNTIGITGKYTNPQVTDTLQSLVNFLEAQQKWSRRANLARPAIHDSCCLSARFVILRMSSSAALDVKESIGLRPLPAFAEVERR